MAWESANPPIEGFIVRIIEPRSRDIGGLTVRRALPASDQQAVGPFVFFDQMGPAELSPGQGLDVRPHPHIGLSTLTWLIEGEILHRDSVGSIQPIRPGEVNWMTAGSGIAHSERTPPGLRATGSKIYGIQMWLALPRSHEEIAPSFQHCGVAELPVIERDGCRVVLIAGSGWGASAPVRVFSRTICAEATLQPGSALRLDAEHEERALFVLAGTIAIAGARFTAGPLLVLRSGVEVDIAAVTEATMIVIGGEPLDGPRHIWWNLVSSRRERIEQAKDDWRQGRFAKVADDDEWIPLPEG